PLQTTLAHRKALRLAHALPPARHPLRDEGRDVSRPPPPRLRPPPLEEVLKCALVPRQRADPRGAAGQPARPRAGASPQAARGPPRRCGTAGATPRRA